MKVKVVTLDNKQVGEAKLGSDVFGADLRKDILHSVVVWQLAKRQSGTHKVKGVGEVAGTKAKPHRQKGTGHARQGSKRSVQMRGGATMFGPVVRSHAHKLPKKVRKLGLKVALSSKHAAGELFVLKDTSLEKKGTSALSKQLKDVGWSNALIIDENTSGSEFAKSVANIKNVDFLPVCGINVYDILRRKSLVLTEAALKKIEERLG